MQSNNKIIQHTVDALQSDNGSPLLLKYFIITQWYDEM